MDNIIQVVWIIIALSSLGSLAGCYVSRYYDAIIKTGNTPGFYGMMARSRCPSCQYQLPWNYMIPIISFFWLRGKCSNCQCLISRWFLWCECIPIICCGFGYLVHHDVLIALVWSFLALCLLVISIIDLKCYHIPDSMLISLIVLWGTSLSVSAYLNETITFYDTIIHDITGAIIGFTVPWGIRKLFFHIRKKEGLGFGDVKLIAVLCLFIHIYFLPWLLFLAAITTLTAILIHEKIQSPITKDAKKIDQHSMYPFGPGLCIAGMAIFIYQSIGMAVSL